MQSQLNINKGLSSPVDVTKKYNIGFVDPFLLKKSGR